MASATLIAFWTVASIFIAISGLLHIISPKMPQLFQDLLLYGKARGKRNQKTVVQYLEVPKQWFTHFYVVGVLVNSIAVYIMFQSYVLGKPTPAWYTNLIEYFTTTHQVHISATSAMLLVLMMFLQNFRRLMECVLVSVYSKGTMNIAHYLLGIVLYSTFHISIMSEAPNLLIKRETNVFEELLEFHNLAGIAMFIWASYQHHVVHEDLANLRKDKSGKVTSYRHKIPVGNWFEYVSCPHYFFEILIYIAFLIVGGLHHTTLFSIVVFVVDNQIVAGYITHMWYHSEYPKYPKNRAAVIPFLI